MFIVETLSEDERSLAEKIYIEYKKYIYLQAYKILNNKQDAEDVVDRVMLDVLSNIEKFQSSDRNETAAQIVIYTRNSAINVYRKNKRRADSEVGLVYINDDDEMMDVDLTDSSADVEKITLSHETADIIKRHLLTLPKEQQDAISLVYGLGYSNVEAAKILGISANAVALRIYKAKKKLIKTAGGELRERIE